MFLLDQLVEIPVGYDLLSVEAAHDGVSVSEGVEVLAEDGTVEETVLTENVHRFILYRGAGQDQLVPGLIAQAVHRLALFAVMGECTEVGMYLAMSRQADREGYPEVAEAFKRYAWEEAEHASKFAELLGDCVWDTKTNLEKRMNAEAGACEDKKRIATRAKALNLDAIHDTVHEMCKDEARHGKGFEGLYNRYFGKK